MKLAILTFHRAYNYGAVLQCLALNKMLAELGIECEVLDYYPKYFYRKYNVLPMWKLGRTFVKKYFYHFLLKNVIKERNVNFEKFIKDNICLSKKTYKSLAMREADISYDGYIVGSDQVWSDTIARFDPVFFLYSDAFTDKKKYSYAASIGKKEINKELYEEYRKRLNSFNKISVREESSVAIIENILGRTPVVSCDPTLLLEKEEWEELAGNTPIVDGDYILHYYVKFSKETCEYALELSRKTSCKVVSIPCCFSGKGKLTYTCMGGKEDREKGFVCFNTASPAEYLNLIRYARYVVTGSFHGTVFSILFHKQFMSQTRWESGEENDRVSNLLHQVGLENRDICKIGTSIEKSIDWQNVDEQINLLRISGREYLQSIIDDVNCYRE